MRTHLPKREPGLTEPQWVQIIQYLRDNPALASAQTRELCYRLAQLISPARRVSSLSITIVAEAVRCAYASSTAPPPT